MADVSVEVPSPLQDCFLHCEVQCVRECCGIHAISRNPELIGVWGQQAGSVSVAEARRQLDELVSVVEDRSRNVSSLFLNHYTGDEPARQQLLDFLLAFRTGLAAVDQRLSLCLRPAALPREFPPRWRTEDVVGLARGINEDPAFDRMPLLADALMDAGCDDEAILEHCRSDEPHTRGCWVIDLVLGSDQLSNHRGTRDTGRQNG